MPPPAKVEGPPVAPSPSPAFLDTPKIDTIPDLLAECPDLAPFFDGPESPWRATVASWPPPWRRAWGEKVNSYLDAGKSFQEAERAACEAVEESRRNPRRTAGNLPDGRRAVKDAVERPRMPQRKPRKAVREAMPTMFDNLTDGNSTTYQREE